MFHIPLVPLSVLAFLISTTALQAAEVTFTKQPAPLPMNNPPAGVLAYTPKWKDCTGAASIKVEWFELPPNNGAPVSRGSFTIDVGSADGTYNFTTGGLTTGLNYNFRVRILNAGNGVLASETSATVAAP